MIQTKLVLDEIETLAVLMTKGVEQINRRKGETVTFLNGAYFLFDCANTI